MLVNVKGKTVRFENVHTGPDLHNESGKLNALLWTQVWTWKFARGKRRVEKIN